MSLLIGPFHAASVLILNLILLNENNAFQILLSSCPLHRASVFWTKLVETGVLPFKQTLNTDFHAFPACSSVHRLYTGARWCQEMVRLLVRLFISKGSIILTGMEPEVIKGFVHQAAREKVNDDM